MEVEVCLWGLEDELAFSLVQRSLRCEKGLVWSKEQEVGDLWALWQDCAAVVCCPAAEVQEGEVSCRSSSGQVLPGPGVLCVFVLDPQRLGSWLQVPFWSGSSS